MTLGKVISVRKEIPTLQSGSLIAKTAWSGQKTSKIISKISRSALSGGAAGVTLATNHSVPFKWRYVKLSGLKRGFLHQKGASRPQNRPELAKKWPKTPENILLGSGRGSHRC